MHPVASSRMRGRRQVVDNTSARIERGSSSHITNAVMRSKPRRRCVPCQRPAPAPAEDEWYLVYTYICHIIYKSLAGRQGWPAASEG
jgi:hypothetical protein